MRRRRVGALHRPDLRSQPLCRTVRADRAGPGCRRHGGLYASHIRNEGAGLLESIDEAIAIGQGAECPVHISHLKASGKATGARSARRSADRRGPGRQAASPPTNIPTSPRAPSSRRWSCRTGPSRVDGDDFARLAADPPAGPRSRREIAAGLDGTRRRSLDPHRAVRAATRLGRARPGRDRRTGRDDPARNRPGNPAAWRGAGDQFRHVRGRRPRGDAHRSSPRPPTARPTCPAAAIGPTRARTARSPARSATPSTRRSSRSSRRSARVRAGRPRSWAFRTGA